MSPAGTEAPILIVEDDPEIRNVLQCLLEQVGHSVYLADCGDQALACLREQVPAPGLILLDMSLPRMSGPEVLKRLREEAFTQPVIVASGLEEEEIRRDLEGQEVEGILVKPYSLPDLVDAVRRFLPEDPQD